MTLDSRLKEIKERNSRPTGSKDSRQSNESLKALANDIGLITSPSLAIAASVSSELMRARRDLDMLLEMVDYFMSNSGRLVASSTDRKELKKIAEKYK